MAVKENASIVSFIDAEAGFPVIVGGAEGRPSSGSTADLVEPVEEFVDLWRYVRGHIHLSGHLFGLIGLGEQPLQ